MIIYKRIQLSEMGRHSNGLTVFLYPGTYINLAVDL